MKILVVDDETALRELLSDAFADEGMESFKAENGKIALELVKEHQPDAVLSDIRMPGGDGIELLKNIMALDGKKPRVYLLTGYTDHSEEEVIKMGASGLFSKPCSISALVEKIKSELS